MYNIIIIIILLLLCDEEIAQHHLRKQHQPIITILKNNEINATQLQQQKQKIIMVVLGCAIDYLQDDRITTALEYADKSYDDSISWFLSGGIKNAIDNVAQTEASRMVIRIHSNQIILDQTAKNTAENFANLRKYVIEQYGHTTLPQIVITTSAFHKDRAERIFNGIFMQNDKIVIKPIWNLGKKACPTCWTDEKIHMRNVENDIKNALMNV